MRDRPMTLAYVLLLGLVIVRGLIYGLLIPYDQAPDENHHFELIKATQLRLAHASPQEIRATAAQVRLARCYLIYPETCPQRATVADFADARLPKGASSFDTLYYLATGWLLHTLALERVQTEIYLLRGLSVICGALVVLIACAVARELFPGQRFLAAGIPAFIVFIPQFAAMSGAINNDKLAEVLLALVAWFSVKIFRRGLTCGYAGGCLTTMALAIFAKRTSLFVIPVFLLLLCVYFWKAALGLKMHLVLGGSLLLLLLGAYGVLRHDAVHDLIKTHVVWLPAVGRETFFVRPELYSFAALKYYAKFSIVLYWSFWGVFGYMTVHLHHFWYLLIASAQAMALYGFGRFVWRVRNGRITLEAWKAKVLYVFAASIVLLATTIFLRSIVLRNDPFLDQGRRFFMVLIPIGVVTILGAEQVIPRPYRRVAGVAGVLGALLLDAVCLSNYILLTFHRISFF